MPHAIPVYSSCVSPHRDRLLGEVRFGDVTRFDGGVLTLALPAVGATSLESWPSSAAVTRQERDGVSIASDGQQLFGVSVGSDEDIEAAARRAYTAIVRAVRDAGFPFLIRAWNHVRDINGGEGDAERYKGFCAGRYDALTTAGFEKPQFPAASAVGMRDGSVAIYFLAAKKPGHNVENPRQMSAYDYPRQYGTRSPSFARATVLDDVVFVSGTASVVGHETLHEGDLAAQTAETLANLSGILAVCNSSEAAARAVKVYVRHPADVAFVDARFRLRFPSASLLVAVSDICRANLLLEAEVIATAAG